MTRIDSTVPHPARRYNYWLGGRDNFAADRVSGDAIAAIHPHVVVGARENRRFMLRTVAYLVGELGVRQFLDIGCGIPFPPDVHDVAQKVAAESRIVYVDNDPLVMCHARALSTSGRDGVVEYVERDLRDPQSILDDPALRKTLDFTKPVALLLIAVLHFFTDDDDPSGVVAHLIEALPSGSYVVLSHGDETLIDAASKAGPEHGTFRPRSKSEVAKFLAGLKILPPGLASIVDQLPGEGPKPRASAREAAMYGVIARKP